MYSCKDSDAVVNTGDSKGIDASTYKKAEDRGAECDIHPRLLQLRSIFVAFHFAR
jgi:hypothetical protein